MERRFFHSVGNDGNRGLLSEFFAALAAVVPDKSEKNIRHLIASYADIARPFASLIPIAGAAVVEASRTLENRLAKPWNVAFREVADELRKLGKPVLVVVDDIDRLQHAELLDLLKVVRLLGRFPGVDFLLAYDEQTQKGTRGWWNSSGRSAWPVRSTCEQRDRVRYPRFDLGPDERARGRRKRQSSSFASEGERSRSREVRLALTCSDTPVGGACVGDEGVGS